MTLRLDYFLSLGVELVEGGKITTEQFGDGFVSDKASFNNTHRLTGIGELYRAKTILELQVI